MYKVGDVLKTTVPYTSTGKDAKNRWFVYLGKVNFAQNPRNIFLFTTTTQIQKYKDDPKCVYVEFKAKDSVFEEDCLLCLDSIEDSFTEDVFNDKYMPEYKDRLSEGKLIEIAQKIKMADIAPIVIKDIISSFRADGIKTR